MYLCLSLGFEGRFRVQRHGHGLADVRDNLYRLLRQQTAEPEAELSPHWRGVAAPLERDRFTVPYWVIGVGTLAALLIIYAGFSFASLPTPSRSALCCAAAASRGRDRS